MFKLKLGIDLSLSLVYAGYLNVNIQCISNFHKLKKNVEN